MAFDAATVWEVRTTGSDSNGGGFKAGATGTDYSQQNAAQTAFTDLVIDATTNTKVTSAAHPFDATSPGNIINVTGGTGFTVQRVQIVSVASGVATCDKSLGTLGSTGGTGNLGGALATPGAAGSVHVGGNTIWVKQGAYSITSASTNVAGGCVSLAAGLTSGNTLMQGYDVTRGDFTGTRPVLTASGITSFTMLTAATTTRTEYSNLEVNCASLASSTGINSTGIALRCKVSNATGNGISNGMSFAISCEATGCGGNGILAGTLNFSCVSHGNTSDGFRSICVACISFGNGAKGFANGSFSNCTSYNNTSDGLYFGSGANSFAVNCLSVSNGGYGFNDASNTVFILACATYSNTSGATSSGSGLTVLSNTALSGSPFTNAAGNDFSLNNTAGAGASCRAASIPTTFAGTSTNNYLDIGAAQHQDTGGAGGMLYHTGGF